MYLAKIEGTYKSKIYIDLIIFKIVRGWRTDRFSYSQQVPSPEFHETWQPIKNVPLALSLAVANGSADISLQVLSENFPVIHQSLPASGSLPMHWQPLKGVIVDAVASFGPA